MISVIIPTLNEPGIEKVIVKIQSALKHEKFEIIVVDKSSDNTPQRAAAAGAKVIKQKSRGYGAALLEGFKHSIGDIIVMIDGDGTYEPYHIPVFIRCLKRLGADMVIGNRFAGMEKGAMTAVNKFGNLLITILINLLFGIRIKDSQCGLRVFKRGILNRVKFRCKDMAFATEMLIVASFKKINILNLPTVYYKRTGKPKLIPYKHGFSILRWILKYYIVKLSNQGKFF